MSELVLAFLLDLALGDPFYPFHPVRLMGRAISAGEKWLRGLIPSEKWAGALLAFLLPVLTFLSAFFLLSLFYRIHFVLGWAANLLGIYASLSVRDLREEGLRVYRDLRKNDLDKARQDVGRIVGRDTASLEKKEVVRAAVEAISESTVDGVIAPLFFAALGGAPLALTYKAVNTLDSMIGHKNERYRNFGMMAAKQDEVWNWLPARLSYYLLTISALFLNRRAAEAFFVGWQDGMSAHYGNSAIPEATFAGTLGLRLGGKSFYGGSPVEKPLLGFPVKDFDEEDILKGVRLMQITAWISLLFAAALRYATQLCNRLIW